MNSFDELCKKLSQNIDEDDTRSRSRTEQEQIRFDYAVKYLLTELWKKHQCVRSYDFMKLERAKSS